MRDSPCMLVQDSLISTSSTSTLCMLETRELLYFKKNHFPMLLFSGFWIENFSWIDLTVLHYFWTHISNVLLTYNTSLHSVSTKITTCTINTMIKLSIVKQKQKKKTVMTWPHVFVTLGNALSYMITFNLLLTKGFSIKVLLVRISLYSKVIQCSRSLWA